MHVVRQRIIALDVFALHNIPGIHIVNVEGTNVLSTLTAQPHLPAAMKNVWILVIALRMRTAVLEIIEEFVPAVLVIQEILMDIDAP